MPVLSWADVVLTWLLMALPLGLCLYWDRALGRTWLVASVRAVLQLLALGYVLSFLFQAQNMLFIGLAALAMISVSAWTVHDRATVKYSGFFRDTLFCLSICLIFILALVSLFLNKDLVKRGEVLLPFLGILLGNSVSGLSLCLAQWLRELKERKQELEFWLSLGATPKEACRSLKAASMRTGLTAILNAMAVAGIVSIPGMMTGQLLAGGIPEMAVKYQLLVLFLMSALVFTSCALLVRVSQWRVFDKWGNIHDEIFEGNK